MKKTLFLVAAAFAVVAVSCDDSNDSKKLSDITISSDFESILMTDELQLTVAFEPSDAENKNLVWESSVPAVAEIDQQGNVTSLSYGTTIITVTAEEGGYTDKCEISVNVIGKASFRTDKTWNIEKDEIKQEWSDVVMVSGARGKTTYDGGNGGAFNADVRENEGYGDLLSWEAVNQYGDILCPDGWRVPVVQDFRDLDIALGGEGINRWIEPGDTFAADTFLNAEIWGGELSGGCDGLGVLSNQGLTGYCWSSSTPDWDNVTAYPLAVNPAMVYVDFSRDRQDGYPVRCIR